MKAIKCSVRVPLTAIMTIHIHNKLNKNFQTAMNIPVKQSSQTGGRLL